MGRGQQGQEGMGRFTSTVQQGGVGDRRDRRARLGLLALSSKEGQQTAGTGG